MNSELTKRGKEIKEIPKTNKENKKQNEKIILVYI